MVISHGAQGMAFHWWRVFEDEVVNIPEKRLGAALGLQPEARRYVGKWLKEMIDSGAVQHEKGGALRMVLAIPTDAGPTPGKRPTNAGRTLDERPADAGRTLEERSTDAGATPDERSNADNPTESQDGTPQEPDGQTDRQTRQTDGGGTRVRAKAPPPPVPVETGTYERVAYEPHELSEPEREPGEPDPEPEPVVVALDVLLRGLFAELCEQNGTKPPLWNRGNTERIEGLAGWLEEHYATDPRAAGRRLLTGFFANAKAKAQSYPLAWLASNPAEYLDPPKPVRDVRKGPAEPSPSSAFKPTDLEKKYGPKPANFDEILKRGVVR